MMIEKPSVKKYFIDFLIPSGDNYFSTYEANDEGDLQYICDTDYF